MTSHARDMVVSGVPYDVVEVDGVAPGSLEDFVGDHVLLVAATMGSHLAEGQGVGLEEGSVRFHEKAEDGGKDVRTWHVVATDGGYCATTT